LLRTIRLIDAGSLEILIDRPNTFNEFKTSEHFLEQAGADRESSGQNPFSKFGLEEQIITFRTAYLNRRLDRIEPTGPW
jgi:hypothetical protein